MYMVFRNSCIQVSQDKGEICVMRAGKYGKRFVANLGLFSVPNGKEFFKNRWITVECHIVRLTVYKSTYVQTFSTYYYLYHPSAVHFLIALIYTVPPALYSQTILLAQTFPGIFANSSIYTTRTSYASAVFGSILSICLSRASFARKRKKTYHEEQSL